MKVIKNYAYNLSYQLLVIILPIITTPYVTRVFSSNDLGTYGYFSSIVTYFILLASLGVANYGTKVISGNRKEIEKNFWGIYSLQMGATLLSLFLYLVLCLTLPFMQNLVAYILGLSLVSKGLDISWLFQGFRGFSKDYCSKYHSQTRWCHLHLSLCQICKRSLSLCLFVNHI
ncbi:flippase Wzx domain protein [Streptococcus pneumoniae 2082239]|nr:flippase Wzx domain protein [Streptococcus pneumoniae 2082239]